MKVEWQSIHILPSDVKKAIFWDKYCAVAIAVQKFEDIWFANNSYGFNEVVDLDDISHWIVLEEPKDCLKLREEFIVLKDE